MLILLGLCQKYIHPTAPSHTSSYLPSSLGTLWKGKTTVVLSYADRLYVTSCRVQPHVEQLRVGNQAHAGPGAATARVTWGSVVVTLQA